MASYRNSGYQYETSPRKIAPEYRFEDSILIVVDGVEYQFKQIVDISIFVSDLKVKLLRMSNYEFWSRVTEKFL